MFPLPQSTCNSPFDVAAYFLSRSSACASREVATRLLMDYARREINALLWVWLIVATCLLVDRVRKVLRLWARARCIPGPPCSFFGHTKLSLPQDFIDFLSILHDKYGPVFKLWSSPMQLLVSVNDPVLVKEILFMAEDKYPCTGRALRSVFGQSNLFFCPYEKARLMRGSLASEFNQNSDDKVNVLSDNVIEEKINSFIQKGCTDCKSISQHLAFSILGTKIFGHKFLNWSNASFYEDLLRVIVKDAPCWSSYRVTPFWKLRFWRYESLCGRLKFLTEDIARQCRDTCSFLCSIDDESGCRNTKAGMKPTFGNESSGNIMGAMFHGCVALATLISSIMERLASDSGLQDKIYMEITSGMQIGSNCDQDLKKLTLLLATVYESARLLPSRSLLQRCSFRKDLILKNGVRIPAGAIIIVPVHLVQTEVSIWGSDARNFNPYRFLTASQDIAATGIATEVNHQHLVLTEPTENASFLPFGSGVRACVAQKFVIHAVASFFASMLARYEVQRTPEPLKPFSTSTSSEILFVKRNI